MLRLRFLALRRLAGWLVAGSAILLCASLLGASLNHPGEKENLRNAGGHDHASMSEEAMQKQLDDWFARHPIVLGPQSTAVVRDTFIVTGFRFDTDGNAATQVDTAKISVGEAVLWRWLDGSHSITNGTGSGDPQAGALFNANSNSLSPTFQFTFNSAGTFPFFCVPHEGFNMRGVVRVSGVADVTPGGASALGFTAGPTPNPTSSGVGFRFALREPGMARAEVYGANGRRVAVILDRSLEAGPHSASWDGRLQGGGAAPAGVYYLRLRLPGFSGTRAFSITR